MNSSALAERVWNVGHHVSWDLMKILGVSSRHYSNLALETIHIKRQRNFLNHNRGKLGTAYVCRNCVCRVTGHARKVCDIHHVTPQVFYIGHETPQLFYIGHVTPPSVLYWSSDPKKCAVWRI